MIYYKRSYIQAFGYKPQRSDKMQAGTFCSEEPTRRTSAKGKGKAGQLLQRDPESRAVTGGKLPRGDLTEALYT